MANHHDYYDRDFGDADWNSQRIRDAVAMDDARLDGVRTARVTAFIVDYLMVALICVPAAIVVAFLGLLTLGLGWLLYFILPGLVAIFYLAFTLGGPAQATPGMKLAGITMQRMDGERIDPFLAVLHGILFWVLLSVPLLLLATFILPQKRLLHDMLLGTLVSREQH